MEQQNPSEASAHNRGVLYIALGNPYLEEARKSAASIKASNPGLAIAVITDASPDEAASFGEFDRIIPAEKPADCGKERYLARDRAAYFQKILPLLLSPFEKTLFLDTDTWVEGSLDPVFTLLDRFDLLVTPCFITHDYRFEREAEPFRSVPEAFGYFNTGFFAFRRGAPTETFIRTWQRLYETEVAQYTVNDQPALRLALYHEQKATFHVLPAHYNTISWAPFVVPGGGKIVMLHGRNPWLQRWAKHFRSGKPAIVGSLRPRLLLRYHLARLFYFFERTRDRWRKWLT